MSKFFKNEKGFTLIEILVVVIIVALLAAISVPYYMRYVEKARATEAQSALRSLANAYNIYRQEHGSTRNYELETAMKDAKLGQATTNNWKFEVVGNPPKTFVATSTAEFSGGEGHQVTYDVAEAKFFGYGISEYASDEEMDE